MTRAVAPPSEDDVERVARAFFEVAQDMAIEQDEGFIRLFWNERPDAEREDLRRFARAAIAALTENR